jgi:outer membrane protein assembly factor BamB
MSTLAGGCGSRTPLGVGDSVRPPPAQTDDPCPFGVLEGAPKPMAGNCSTRDGRARVAAPRSPHVTWSLPALPLAERIGATLATDASDHAYLLGEDHASFQVTLRRIDAFRGAVDWASAFAPGMEAMPTPFLRQAGRPEAISTQPSQIASFDPDNGAPSKVATPGLEFGLLTPDPAIGADGSLYFLDNLNGDGSSGAPFVATRVAPDGTITWSSTELSHVAVPEQPATHVEGFPSGIALGAGGTVLVEFAALATPYAQYTVVVALDPSTGAVVWQRTLQGQALGGLVVAPDGSIAVVAYESQHDTAVVVLEPTGQERHRLTLPMTNRLCGVARDGTLLAFLEIGGGTFGLATIDASGRSPWQVTGNFVDAFLTSDGTVVALGDDVRGLDLATGAMRWSVAPPSGAFPAGVCDAALTSTGSIVALQCNGTVFGAAD